MAVLELEDIDEFLEYAKKSVTAAVMSAFKIDEQGRLWIVDKEGHKVKEIDIDWSILKERTHDDRQAIKDASKMSLQKKEERLVINLPAWLKERLKKRAKQTDQSMNEIIRIALTEYLSK